MEVLNRAAIKKEARSFIGQENRWLRMFLAILPILILSGGISTGITVWHTISENGNTQSTTYSTGGNLISVLLIPFTVAMAGYFLNAIRGFNPEWKSLYKEGIDRYGKYFVTGFLTDLFIGLWSLLLVVPGIIKAFEYSQVHYIIHDNPNLTPSQARDISRRMTDGFKGELFILSLSFFLWFLLVACTAGIAYIYVAPYMYTTQAMYYENLKTYALSAGKVAPQEFGILPVPPYGDVPPAGAPYTQNPNPYTEPQQPYSANPNPYTAPQPPYNDPNPYTAPQQPVTPDAPQAHDFTPPSPEETFKPGENTMDTTNLNGEPVDPDAKQDF